jgi:hypothetical protein
MKLKRIWLPIESWEELQWNMWGEVANRQRYLERAVIFTGNHKLYGRYMNRVVREWPNSCINALTDQALNRRAWIGHAACALALYCPEDITRQAWGLLSHEQRLLANKQADRAIQSWEMRYRQGQRIRNDMDAQVLPQGHSRGSATQSSFIRQGSILARSSHCAFKE